MSSKGEKNPLPALLFWVLIWHLGAAALENPLLLPTPLQVLKCLLGLIRTAAFWKITALSIGRILLGVLGGVGLAVCLAALSCISRWMDALISPVMHTIQATPVASFTILVLIWLNRDFVPVLICGMMVLPVVYQSVCTAIRMTDRQLLEMAKVYRLHPVTVVRRIYMPSVLPIFRSACASAIGLGWKAGIAAEVLTVPRQSIGRMISESKLYLLTEELFAWTLAVVVFSMLLQKGMFFLLKGRNSCAETH